MIAIGETLRRERLRRNLDLKQISDELKLSMRFLEAIESERFDRLPGGVFTRSFVRQYARLLGLDEDEMAAEVARLVEPPEGASPTETKTQPSVSGFPLPPAVSWDRVSDSFRTRWPDWLPGLAMAVVVTLGCSGVYVWWQRTQHPAERAVKPPAAPAQLAPAAPPPVVEQAPAPPPPDVQPLVAPVAASPEPSIPRTAPAPPPSVASVPAPPDASGAPLHVQLTAREIVWVRAISNGKTLLTVTLAPNESRTLDAKGSLELRLGNAGGVDISLNGTPIGAVGPKGQIRTVQLTPGGFSIVSPSKPAPADPL